MTYSTEGSSSNVLWAHDKADTTPLARRTWSRWAGYSTVTVKHGDGSTYDKTVTVYHRGLNDDRTDAGDFTRKVNTTTATGTVVDNWALPGQVAQLTTYLGDTDTIVSANNHRYSVHQTGGMIGNWPMGYQQANISREDQTITRTPLAAGGERRIQTETVWDDTGLPTTVKDFGDTAVEGDETCAATVYARNTNNGSYLLNFPKQVVTRAGIGCADADTRLAETRTFYDGASSLDAQPTKGWVTKTQTLMASGPEVWATAQVQYDDYGRPVATTDVRGQVTTTAYTPARGGPLRQTTVTNPLGHIVVTTSDARRGMPLEIVDANGKASRGQYDPLGRLTKAWLANRSPSEVPDLEYGYTLANNAPNVVVTKKLGPSANQITSYQLYDGKFRLRQVQTPAPVANGGRIIADTQFDALGRSVTESMFWNSDAPAATMVGFNDADVKNQDRTVYDGASRVVSKQVWSQNAMKWQTATTYTGEQIAVTPPDGGTPTTTITAANGQPSELRRHTGGSTSSGYQSIRYQYDVLNRLVKVSDPDGNTWTTTYDVGGRVVSSTDPDKGTSASTYNAAGDLTTITDARGITLSYAYDGLGRKTSLWQNAVGTGTKRAEWFYDGLAKGQLNASTRYVNGEAYTSTVTGFDDAYRRLGTTVTLPTSLGALSGPWTTTTAYNVDGSVRSTAYPAAGGLPAETVSTGYDLNGYALTMSGLDTYIADTAYYPWGDIRRQTLGSGTKRLQVLSTVDESTQRMTEYRTSTEDPTSPGTFVPQLIETYDHDNGGNLKRISEVDAAGSPISTQCFTFDALRQLSEAWTTTNSACQSTPSQAVVGGPDPYWSSYRYNSVGSRIEDTRHTADGDTTRKYSYPTPGGAQAHAATAVTTTGASSGMDSYDYDVSGNTIKRAIAGRPNQTLTWDVEGHLASIADNTGTSSYTYTPDGDRLLAVDPTGTTLYLDGFDLRRTVTGVSCTRYYGNAVRTTAEGLTWQSADHHGTTELSINAGTLQVAHRRSDPFGNPRGVQPAWPTNRGFVNGVQDPSGLTHLGAREYEPTTGRFISVDPIIDISDVLQMNGYAYANNNPPSMSDPTGLWAKGCIDTCHTQVEIEYNKGPNQTKYSKPGGSKSTHPTDYCSVRSNEPSCQRSRPGAAIFLGSQLIVAPSEEQLHAAIQQQVYKGCDPHPGFFGKLLGSGCGESSELLEADYAAEICKQHTDWCENQDVSQATLVDGVAGAGYSMFGKTGRVRRPPHVAKVQVFDAEGNLIYEHTLRSGNMTPEEAALKFPARTLETHTEARAMRLPLVRQPGNYTVIEGQYSPCSSCRGKMRMTAEERNVTVVYRWNGQVWVADPELAGARYGRAVRIAVNGGGGGARGNK